MGLECASEAFAPPRETFCRECPRPSPPQADVVLPRRRMRLQDRARRAAGNPGPRRPGRAAGRTAGRHRNGGRRGRLQAERASGHRRDDGLLHADRRRPVRLRRHRRHQRHLRHLCDGRHTVVRARARRHARRQAARRHDPQDPRGRRVGVREGRHSDRRRPHDRFGRTHLRPGRDRRRRPRQRQAQRGCQAGRRAHPGQAVGRGHLQRRVEEGIARQPTATQRCSPARHS